MADTDMSIISGRDFSMFGESKGMADVTLIVEGQRIPVSKAVLQLVSPVFLPMFQGDFREKEESEIPLPGKKLDSVEKFLRCIFPDILDKVTAENVYDVLPLANEYQVDPLKTACEQVLLKEMIELEAANSFAHVDRVIKVYRYLVIAEKYHLDELLARCVDLASGVTKKDREAAEKVHPILEQLEKDIDKQAIKKLEQKLRKNKNTIETSIADLKQLLTWKENLHKLRWVYHNDKTSMKEEAISKVVHDRSEKGWETYFKDEFQLLTEDKEINRAIDNQYVELEMEAEMKEMHSYDEFSD